MDPVVCSYCIGVVSSLDQLITHYRTILLAIAKPSQQLTELRPAFFFMFQYMSTNSIKCEDYFLGLIDAKCIDHFRLHMLIKALFVQVALHIKTGPEW